MLKQVKLISGKYRGHRIATPGGKTHPMGERERLALFNILRPYLDGAVIIDAYAGSGALGIEALSCGAKKVIFIEKAHLAMKTILANCAGLGVPAWQTIFCRETVATFCKEAASYEEKADFIIADPPYDNFDKNEINQLAVNYLKPEGILALSHPGEAPQFDKLDLSKTNKYAAAHLSFYKLA